MYILSFILFAAIFQLNVYGGVTLFAVQNKPDSTANLFQINTNWKKKNLLI